MAINNMGVNEQELLYRMQKWEEWKNNPVKWAEECVTVPEAGDPKLVKLYEPQKRVLEAFYKDHFLIMNKTRQVGGSFLFKIITAHVILFYENVLVGIISKTGNEASVFSRDIKNIILNIPYEWARPSKFKEDNKRSFILPNNSGVCIDAVSKENPDGVFRGRAVTVLIIDEAAHIPRIDAAYTGVAPTLSKTQQVAIRNGVPYGIVLISTPNKTYGIGAWYYKMWLEASSDEDTLWKAQTIHWKEIEDFANDPQWYINMCAILENNPLKIAQELELEFIGSDKSLFDRDTQRALNSLINNNLLLAETRDFKKRSIKILGGRMLILQNINPDKFYIVGVDIASAAGSDYSAIQIIDYLTCEQVIEYKGKLEPKLFANNVLKEILKMIPNNIVVVENSGGYGLTVLNELQFDEYKEYNLYGEYRGGTDKKKFIHGLSTNSRTRPLIIEAMYNTVKENVTTIKSERLAVELLSLCDNNGKIQAEGGFNDDLVMAFGFACYVRKYGQDQYIDLINTDMLLTPEERKRNSDNTFINSFIIESNNSHLSKEELIMIEIKEQIRRDKLKIKKQKDLRRIKETDDVLEDEFFSSGFFNNF